MLSNPRHERFAQALAAGKTADQAYQQAGYKPSRPHASRLATDGNVKARVAELQSRVVEGVVLTRQWVIEKLIANARKADERQEGAVVNRALELLGKEIGMFVDRVEQDSNVRIITDAPVTDDEWEQRYVNPVGTSSGASESAH
jgi:phage terminase small subunit